MGTTPPELPYSCLYCLAHHINHPKSCCQYLAFAQGHNTASFYLLNQKQKLFVNSKVYQYLVPHCLISVSFCFFGKGYFIMCIELHDCSDSFVL